MRTALTFLAPLVLLAGCESEAPPTQVGRANLSLAAGDGPFSFTTFQLGAATGSTCSDSTACTNTAGEPMIRADATGVFYVTSELGVGSGTLAWRSTDGGLSYTALQSPNQLSQSAGGIGVGGGDTDIGVATAPNALGTYNVYAASLSLANVTVSTSQDRGTTWRRNVLSAVIPVDDREWIAADGASKVCVSYHDAATFNIDVNCSYDAAATFTQISGAIDAQHAFLIENNAIGNLAIDPSSHVIYQAMSGVANAIEAAVPSSYHAVWMGVSTDGGRSFTTYPVYVNPDASASYGHQFVNVSVDRGGTVYAVYTDNHNLYYSYSSDAGRTWTGPIQVNQAPSATAVMPWSAACGAGELVVVWYGTPYYDGVNPPDSYPMSAAWKVYFAQNRNAASPTGNFTQVAATPVIHFGGVCESGVTCSGNRDLYDDFGVAVNPLTGFASITYSDDQPSNSSTHTSIATQVSGPRICRGK